MTDNSGGTGDPAPSIQEKGSGQSFTEGIESSATLWNVMGRTERALRMALGGALIMALTMCDISSLHYSFKYVGPFLFFVMGTLAPPFLSSAVILLFSGLFCILLASAVATALIACLLVSSGGQALCVVVYSLTVAWVSFLTISKTKDMTLIGSYIMLYAVPLATLVASAYAHSGIIIDVTPERFAALQQFIATSTPEQIREAVSHFFLISPENVDSFVAKLADPATINFLIKVIIAKLGLQLPIVPQLPANKPVDPKNAFSFLFGIMKIIPRGKHLIFDMKVPRSLGLHLSQDWMYDIPFFVDGVSGEHVLVGARPGTWFIKALWVASGSLGLLRNLVIFAFLGFAVYLLVMLIPPIRRQRDVAVRELASACSAIRKCLRTSQRALEDATAHTTVGEGNGECGIDNGQAAHSDSNSDFAPAVDSLDSVVLSLMESEKAVLLSGMEPFLLYPGPGIWTMNELEAVRKRLIQCCMQTQHMAQLFRSTTKRSLSGQGWLVSFLESSGNILLARSIEMYELCEKLLTTFPYICSPSSSKKRVDDLIEQMSTLENEMRRLALEIFRHVEADGENALAEMATTATAVPPAGNDNEEAGAPVTENGKPLQRVVSVLPICLAITAFVHAGYSEPVRLSRCVRALGKAQVTSTRRGLLMNIMFPFVPVLVHFNRLVIAPLSALLFWRHTWRGPRAWWKEPEAWYTVKLVIPLIILFACGICLPDFRQYSWGVEVTERPVFVDISEQGATTRMVPWFLLGFITVLQTTYNGTVHRALARTFGIIFGAFFAWAGLMWAESNLAGLIAFCAVTVFVDIFIFVDPDHPLDGFHKKWGYSGVVFTYTQALIVTLATEEMGGLTGGRNYLVTTRILSNILGILLAVLVAHLPPLASATTSSCIEYSRVMQDCTAEVSKLINSFLCICGEAQCEQRTTAISGTNVPSGAEDNTVDSSLQEESECKKVTAALNVLDSECKDRLGSASRLLREGRYVPVLLPWRTSRSLDKIHVAVAATVNEAKEAAQLVLDICDHQRDAQQGSSSCPGEQELGAMPLADSTPKDHPNERALSKSLSVSLMQKGNCTAIRELFQTSKGRELREALRSMCDSTCTLAAAAGVELCATLPAFGDKLMCRTTQYAYQGDAPGGLQQAYESCRSAMDSTANRVIVALAECLGEHCAAHGEERSSRTASTFVVMRLLHRLQSMKLSFDKVHAALIEGSKRVPCECIFCNQLN